MEVVIEREREIDRCRRGGWAKKKRGMQWL